MKLAFILPGRGFSGGIRCGIRMADELLHRGHDVRILYKRQPYNFKNITRSLYKKFILNPPQDWIAQSNCECTSFTNLCAKLVGNRDIVIAIGPDCVKEMIKLPHECGRKVFYARGLTLRNPNLRQEAWSEHIPKIAVSNYVYRELLKAGDDGVVAVVPNGIDRDEYFPDNAQEDRIAVGTVYGSGIAKDPQTILSVFDMLHKSRPNLPLICFSSERRFGSLTQTVQCEYLPSVAKARKLYSKCAVWFCASRSEGFGNPLLEAMACGCAVVCADCGGPNDFLKSGINGVIVEKGAPDKMVSEILNIIDDKSKRTQMVNIAFEIVKTLSWSYAAHKMEIAMGRIISNQKC